MTEQLNTVNEFDSFWSSVKSTANDGSGGTVGRVEIQYGWKVYAPSGSGLSQQETFFAYQPGNRESLKTARARANKLIVEKGFDTEPANVLCIRIYKADVLSKDVSKWDGDKFNFIATWTEAYVKTVEPKLMELKVARVGDFWAKVSWARDTKRKPRLVNKLDEDGNPVIGEDGNPVMEEQHQLFAYISEVYDSREAAMEANGIAAEGETPAATTTQFPEGFDAESWKVIADEIKAAKAAGTTVPSIADSYGLSVAWVTKALNS